MATTSTPTATTTRGALRGVREGGVDVFRGIPYAEAPMGDRRFAAPERRSPWTGERDATAYGATCPKPGYEGVYEGLMDEPSIPGDDHLNLNVWTPADRGDGAPLPVLVWIHGGAFRNGSGAPGVYDGSAFARDGVVCVTINYRLGMDGFGLLPDAPANRGLLDQVCALEWVRDEIGAFGGDPARVTVAGESAGGMSVAALLAMPSARGLFRGAIAQSGAGHHAQERVTAERVAQVLGERLGVPPTAAGFSSVDVDAFVAAQTVLNTEVSGAARAEWGALGLDSMAFEPVVDGDVLPRRPIDALVADPRPEVDVLAGWTANEYRFWLVPLGALPHLTAEHVAAAADTFGLPAPARAAYDDLDPGDAFEAIVADWCFRVPAIRLAEARVAGAGDAGAQDAPAPGPAAPGAAPGPASSDGAQGRTWLYEFAWPSPQFADGGGLGACHTTEIGFAFDTVRAPGSIPMLGPDAPQDLADEVHGAWVAFATGGDPGWETYDGTARPVRVLGAPGGSRTVEDPLPDRRRAWDGVR